MKKDLHWKVLDSFYISREPWFTVRRERVELPGGNIVPSYYILDYPEWVNIIAVTPDEKMVMIRQYRHGLGQVNFELAAGTCEKSDSSPLDTARRELQEETGYGGGKWREFAVFSANPATSSNLTHTFLAEGVIPVSGQHLDSGEDISVHLFEMDEVLDMLKKGEIVQALMAASLWKYFYEKKRQQ